MTGQQTFDELESLMFEQRKITEKMEKIVRELTRHNTEVTKIEMQVPRNDVPEMITLKQASEKTGISYYALRGLCLENKITYIKSGNKYLVNFGSLVDFLNRGDAND